MEKYNCNDYCMNLLLSNSCQNPSEIEGYSEMRIELHCVSYIVTCKTQDGFNPQYRKETKDFEVYPFPYEILSIRRE